MDEYERTLRENPFERKNPTIIKEEDVKTEEVDQKETEQSED